MKYPGFCCRQLIKRFSSKARSNTLSIGGKDFPVDSHGNVTPKILEHIGKNIYLREFNPLSLIRQNIINFFYSSFTSRGNPVFSVYDNLHPVVSVEGNFDSLLVPADHVSRQRNDCYYVNTTHLLRAHMTAHQCELMRMGLDNFLMVGDVYRRDEIDSSHYPVFHQLDAVRLRTANEVR